MNEIVSAATAIKTSGNVVALTGAGISAESGIDTFRGRDGLWTKYNIEEYATIDAFRQDPAKAWSLFEEMDRVIMAAEPNAGHRALAELEAMGLLQVVVTQNVDSLHQRAGNTHVLEFHGNGRHLICPNCSRKYPSAEKCKEEMPPHCGCGTILKPNFVLFGEGIPSEVLAESFLAMENSSCMLVTGTSAMVYPAAQLPFTAKERGATIIEVNTEATELTNFITDIFLEGKAATVLPQLVEEIKKNRNQSE